MTTIDKSIKVYKTQIEIAEKRKRKEELKIFMSDNAKYHNLKEINNFITELKRSLLWYEKKKKYEQGI